MCVCVCVCVHSERDTHRDTLTHTRAHTQGCCYNEGHNTCEVCYTEDTLDCAHVTHICAARYARIQVSLSVSLCPCLFFVLIYEKKEYPDLTIIGAGSYAIAAMRAYTCPPPPKPPLPFPPAHRSTKKEQ